MGDFRQACCGARVELDILGESSFTQRMMKSPASAFLALLLFVVSLHADQRAAMVRANGLLVFLPEVGGSGTYGTYLVPNELGRDSLDRFVHLGNPIQINFLPPSELPPEFSGMEEREKLEAFFQTESRHLSKAFNQDIPFTDLKPLSFVGVDYLTGHASLLDASGKKLDIRITARAAGEGILHASYQPENPETAAMCQLMVDKLLRSFDLVQRPLTPAEMTNLSKESRK